MAGALDPNGAPRPSVERRPGLAALGISAAVVFVAALSLFRMPQQVPNVPVPAAVAVIAQEQDTPGNCQVYVLHHDVADEKYIRWVGPWAQSISCSRATTPGAGFVETGHHAHSTFFGNGNLPNDGDWRYMSEANR